MFALLLWLKLFKVTSCLSVNMSDVVVIHSDLFLCCMVVFSVVT